MKRLGLALAAVAAIGGGAVAVAQTGSSTDPNAVGPTTRIQPSGRKLQPYGHLNKLGNHPGGGALTPDGRFLWTLSSGRGRNDIRIVDIDPARACAKGHRGSKCRRRAAKRAGRVVQTIPMPGTDGGMTFAPNGRTAYVSGTPDSEHKDEKAPTGTPGLKGDTIHVFRISARGRASRAGTIDVPPPSSAPAPQNFPPTSPTAKMSWPRDLAVSRDGKTLLAALNLADAAAVIDIAKKSVKYVSTGSYPYGAAILRDGKTGLISNEASGTVSVIDLASATKTKDIQVGPNLSHPEGMAIDPRADRAYVAVAHQDLIAVIDTKSLSLARTLSVERPQGIGTMPTQVSVTSDGCRLLSADSGEDAVAIFALKSGCTEKEKGRLRKTRTKPFQLIGRVPVASYPVFAGATPGRKEIAWIAAKGLGVGPNPNGPNPLSPKNNDDQINTFSYLPSIVDGMSGFGRFPTDREIRKLNPRSSAQIVPVNHEQPPAGTPLRPDGPIKHVFYVVRENRTYDQVLGDDSRGDGDPKLELFGPNLTPNAHALAQRFPLLDHVFANSEASIDGHFWTAAGTVPDYVTKNWHQNYAGRGRPYDFGVYAVTWPAKRFLFDQADRDGISWFNYGEAVAGVVPLPDKDRGNQENQGVLDRFAKSDLGEPGLPTGLTTVPLTACYPNDSSIGTDSISGREVYDSSLPAGSPTGSLSRIDCFRGRFAQQLATNSVPAFNYVVLTNDHTNGLSPGRRTPQAMVADNDFALGQLVDTISHSSIWQSSMIIVMEDDSQDGADHVDAHRIPAFVISPWTKRGAVVHTRYDFPSLIRTLELPIGMHAFTLFDALATPLYDAFDTQAQNNDPYNAVAPSIDLNQRNANTPQNRAITHGLNLIQTDQVTQRQLDKQLWRATRGYSAPPPPGPNAEGGSGKDPGDG